MPKLRYSLTQDYNPMHMKVYFDFKWPNLPSPGFLLTIYMEKPKREVSREKIRYDYDICEATNESSRSRSSVDTFWQNLWPKLSQSKIYKCRFYCVPWLQIWLASLYSPYRTSSCDSIRNLDPLSLSFWLRMSLSSPSDIHTTVIFPLSSRAVLLISSKFPGAFLSSSWGL